MPPASHAVQHDRAQQGFDRTEHRNGKRRRQQRAKGFDRPRKRRAIGPGLLPGPVEVRQHGRNAVPARAIRQKISELRADGVDRMTGARQQQRCANADEYRRQVSRQREFQSRPGDEHAERQRTDKRRAAIERAERTAEFRDLPEPGFRQLVHRQAEEILQLQGRDHHTDAEGETERHRFGDVFDEPPEARDGEPDEDHTGEQGRDEQSAEPERGRYRLQDHDEGSRGPGNAEARSARERDDEARDHRGVKAVLRRHAARDRKRHGKRYGDDADRDARDQVLQEALARVGFFQDAVAECARDAQGKQLGAVRHGWMFQPPEVVAVTHLRCSTR